MTKALPLVRVRRRAANGVISIGPMVSTSEAAKFGQAAKFSVIELFRWGWNIEEIMVVHGLSEQEVRDELPTPITLADMGMADLVYVADPGEADA